MSASRVPRVVCVGSINVDVSARAAALPAPGETVVGSLVEISPGGKGANQAVAALRMGAAVTLIGAIGTDEFAKHAKAFLEGEGFEATWISQVDGPTGMAVIVVDQAGQKSIVIIPGANSSVTPSLITGVELTSHDICLMQNEIPEETNLAVLRAAKAVGAVTVMNLAPYRPTAPELLTGADFLVVNKTEFSGLIHLSADELTPPRVAGLLAEGMGVAANILVTLGSDGVIARINGQVSEFPAHSVKVVDATGAGDALCGAFGAALAQGTEPTEAIRIANAAAALSVQAPGAAPSMPQLKNVMDFLAAARAP